MSAASRRKTLHSQEPPTTRVVLRGSPKRDAMTDRKKPDDDDGPPVVSRTKTPRDAAGRDFQPLQAWARDLGKEWTEVLAEAGINNRTTSWRIDQGRAGGDAYRRIETVLKAETARRSNAVDLTEEWASIGNGLLALTDPDVFRTVLNAARRILDGQRAEQQLRDRIADGKRALELLRDVAGPDDDRDSNG